MTKGLLALLFLMLGLSVAEARTSSTHSPMTFDTRHDLGGYVTLTWSHNRVVKRKAKARSAAKRSNKVKVAAKPKPGTLGAYRQHIAKAVIRGGAPAKGLGNIQGLRAYFIARLAALRDAMPKGLGFSVGSGFRSYAEQARLHALKPRLAAAPGRSQHERGLAGDLKFADRESYRWVHRYARKHGLTFPIRYEGWHIEPVGVTRFATKRHRYASIR